MQTLYLITTGGTIEKVYLERTGSVANLGRKIDKYLCKLRLPGLNIKTAHIMNKDSLEMTAADRESVLRMVEQKMKHPAPVVITHGTDTLVATGLLLKKRLKRLKFPVVLTGAMTPLGFEKSDGLQNLTESLLAARLLPPGVYLVIHSQVFPIDHVRKDRKHSRFVRTTAQTTGAKKKAAVDP
jgi:L-asparaginase